MFQNVIFHQKTFLQALKTILHTLDDSLWWLEQVLKHRQNAQFCSFSLCGYPLIKKISKNDDFSWFFKIGSNHQKSSSKVLVIVFRVSRGYFRPHITFLDTIGQIIGHSGTSQKSPKSPLWAKIGFSTKCFKSLKMMLYGRKWVPGVF